MGVSGTLPCDLPGHLSGARARVDPASHRTLYVGVVGSTSWDCEPRGRAQIIAAIREFVDEFDRDCARTVRPAGPPFVGVDAMRVPAVAVFTRGDSDELALHIDIIAAYRDGLISD